MGDANLKNKNSSLWNKTLFLEGIRQTKWIALTAFIICGLFTVLENLQSTQYKNIADEMNTLSYSLDVQYIGINSSWICVVLIIVMMFRLFSFLNRQNSCDFYYSISEKKSTIFITFCSVVFTWAIAMMVMLLASGIINYAITSGGALGLTSTRMVGVLSILACIILAMGALAIGMSTTGNGLTNILTMLIILFVPRFLVSYYLSGYYEIMPYLTENEAISKIFNNEVNLAYSQLAVLIDSDFNSLLDSDKLWLPILYSTVLGIFYLVIGGILFCKRKSEAAGAATLNHFWQLILRLAISLTLGMTADIVCTQWIIHGESGDSSLESILLFYFIALLVWLLFEFVTTRQKKRVLVSLKQLPIFAVVNIAIVASFLASAYITSKVPNAEEVDSIYFEDGNVLTSTSYYSQLPQITDALDDIQCTDKETIELILTQLENDMLRFKDRSLNYSLGTGSGAVEICMKTGDREIVRNINYPTYVDTAVKNFYAKEAANIYDYEMPIAPIDISSSSGSLNEYYYSDIMDGYSFAWDFSREELVELYNCFYEEAKTKDLPLKTFLGRDYNKEGIFDFLVYTDYEGNSVDIPIGLETPDTLEKLANMGNKRRTDYDFSWFVDYVRNIGKEEKGAVLEMILYAGNGNVIRYESFSWWSDYTADLSEENLMALKRIDDAHKNDGPISAEGNLLMLVYKNIDGVETTGKWYNLTDEETELVDSMIWEDGVFERYRYFDYF